MRLAYLPELYENRVKQGFKGLQPLDGVWGVPTFSLFPLGGEGKKGAFEKPCIPPL
jgi:hypothetical protein